MPSVVKIALIALLCLAAWVVLRLLFGVFDAQVFAPISENLGLPMLQNVSSFWLFFLVLIVLPGRWTSIPKRLEVRGTIDIDASPEAIWATIGPFPHDPYWGAAISRTTSVPKQPDRLDFHFEAGSSEAGWPQLQAVIDAEVQGEYFAYRFLNSDAFPGMAKDLVLSEYFLEPIHGGTRVTQIEHLCRIRLTTIPLLLFLNPSQDAMKRLKAVMEGQEDTSWMGRTARDLAEDS